MNYLEMKKKALHLIVGKVKGFVRSVTGVPPIALESCADNMSIIDYKIHGNSIQDGTPSPDNPVEVQSVGELVTDETDINYGKYKIPVTARSKNYCNPIITGGVNANGKYSIDNKGIVSWKRTSVNASGRVILKTFLKAGTYDFTIKIFNVSGYSPDNSLVLYLNNNLKFANGSSVSYGKSTLVVSEDCYISFYVYSMEPNSERIIGNSCSWSIMITDNGVSGDDYEPYHEPVTTNIYLDEPLRKVGDYADYIDFKNSMVVRNVAKLELKRGSFITYNSLPQKDGYSIYVWFSFNLSAVNQCFCTHLRYTNNNYGYEASNHITFTTNNNRIWIGIDSTIVEPRNNAKFKEWLTNNNPIIYYVPKTPTQTSISLPILPTFKGITTVYEVGTTIQPSNMEAEYYSTLKGE